MSTTIYYYYYYFWSPWDLPQKSLHGVRIRPRKEILCPSPLTSTRTQCNVDIVEHCGTQWVVTRDGRAVSEQKDVVLLRLQHWWRQMWPLRSVTANAAPTTQLRLLRVDRQVLSEPTVGKQSRRSTHAVSKRAHTCRCILENRSWKHLDIRAQVVTIFSFTSARRNPNADMRRISNYAVYVPIRIGRGFASYRYVALWHCHLHFGLFRSMGHCAVSLGFFVLSGSKKPLRLCISGKNLMTIYYAFSLRER